MKPRRIPIDAQLTQLAEHSIGMALTDPISRRLDELIGVAELGGARTNRKELVAALILDAEPDGAALASLVQHYRTAHVREALLDYDSSTSSVVYRSPAPGPRKRRRSPA